MKIVTASRYKHRKNGSLNMISISHKNNFCHFSGKVIRKEVFCDFRSTTIDNKTLPAIKPYATAAAPGWFAWRGIQDREKEDTGPRYLSIKGITSKVQTLTSSHT